MTAADARLLTTDCIGKITLVGESQSISAITLLGLIALNTKAAIWQPFLLAFSKNYDIIEQ
jgi:hypothetical protein